MRKTAALLGIAAIFLFASYAMGQTLEVRDAAIATGVENLVPTGTADSFPSDIGKLYAFTRIVGGDGQTGVKHLWYYGDKLMFEITLDVKSGSWRTYSSKTILPSWTGDWKVVVAAEDGAEIHSIPFTVK